VTYSNFTRDIFYIIILCHCYQQRNKNWHILALSKVEGEVPKSTIVPKTIEDQVFHLWPESGKPLPYETKPFFPFGLRDDEVDLLSLPDFRGDGNYTQDLDFAGLLLRQYEECISTRREGRD